MADLDWKCQQCFDTCGRPDQEIHYVCVVQLWNYHPKEHSSNPYIFNHQWEIGIKIKSVQRHYSSENLWVINNMWKCLLSCYVQMFYTSNNFSCTSYTILRIIYKWYTTIYQDACLDLESINLYKNFKYLTENHLVSCRYVLGLV